MYICYQIILFRNNINVCTFLIKLFYLEIIQMYIHFLLNKRINGALWCKKILITNIGFLEMIIWNV